MKMCRDFQGQSTGSLTWRESQLSGVYYMSIVKGDNGCFF